MTLFTTPLARQFVGFDSLFEELNKMADRKESNYPAYNVVKDDDEHYRIEVALAGFSSTDINLKTENNAINVAMNNMTKNNLINAPIQTNNSNASQTNQCVNNNNNSFVFSFVSNTNNNNVQSDPGIIPKVFGSELDVQDLKDLGYRVCVFCKIVNTFRSAFFPTWSFTKSSSKLFDAVNNLIFCTTSKCKHQ